VVFVVDDEDALRESLQEILEEDGYLVLTARDGHEGLRRMRGLRLPSVAVIDLVMPDMDGEELIAAMKADPLLADIPIIVITSHDLSARELPAAVRLLRKPFQPDRLRALIGELCAVP